MASQGLVVLLVAVALVGAGPGPVAAEPRAGTNARVGADPGLARGNEVATVAVNPVDSSHVVVLSEDFLNRRCTVRASFDGGSTWSTTILAAPAGFESGACSRFDSGDYAHVDVGGLAFGSGQRVYATFSWNRPGEGDSILVATSTDGGRTFSTGVVAISGGPVPNPTSDGFIRPKVGVEPGASGADRVYVSSWRLTTDASSERRIVTAASSDGGLTFGAPVDVQGPDRAREQSRPVVGPGGVLYLAWRTTNNGVANSHVVGRSTDQGLTWSRSTVGFAPGTRSSDPRLAVDPRTGTLYLVFWSPSGVGVPITPSSSTPATSGTDVFLQRSVDGGATWSGPLRLNDDPVGNAVHQRLPEVAVAPDGRVDVVFEDRRHAYPGDPLVSADLAHSPARGMEDIFLTSSRDFGVTFSSNRRVTDRSINLDVGLDRRVTGGFYPPTLSPAGTGRLVVAWGDSREGNFHTDTHDVYLSTVELGGGPGVATTSIPPADAPSTSAALSRRAYPGGIETQGLSAVTKVVVVNEGDLAGALAGSVLARDGWGTVLLSAPSGLSGAVSQEVARLEARGAYVIGSEAELGAAVVADLAAAGVPAGSIQRLEAATPAATAARIAGILDTRTQDDKDARRPAFPAVVVANPASKEAAAAAGLAASLRLPVLFAGRDGIPHETADALATFAIDRTLVVGGPGSVGDAAMASLPSPTRLGGPDAAATSLAVVGESLARGLPSNVVYVADTERPVEAAVMGAAVARPGGLLLLVPGADPTAALAALDRLGLRPGADGLVVLESPPTAPPPPGSTVASGYRMVAGDGGVFTFGDRVFRGSTGNLRLNRPVVGGATEPSGLDGYWLVASDGGVFTFNVGFYGSLGDQRLSSPAVEIEPTPSGRGYWVVLADGKVHAFGDARHHGDMSGRRLNAPVIGMAVTETGGGYWLVAGDGGIFSFGDAGFFGSTGSMRLNAPVIDLGPVPGGGGYYLVASDGGVFTFGSARFHGSTGSMRLNAPVVGVLVGPTGSGYWLAAADGGIFTFGALPFLGSMGATRLNSPVLDLIN